MKSHLAESLYGTYCGHKPLGQTAIKYTYIKFL